eukprot:2052475-Pleurochrysis_carterae.AAC.1
MALARYHACLCGAATAAGRELAHMLERLSELALLEEGDFDLRPRARAHRQRAQKARTKERDGALSQLESVDPSSQARSEGILLVKRLREADVQAPRETDGRACGRWESGGKLPWESARASNMHKIGWQNHQTGSRGSACEIEYVDGADGEDTGVSGAHMRLSARVRTSVRSCARASARASARVLLRVRA